MKIMKIMKIMKKIIIIIFFAIPFLLFSQKKSNDTIYIKYNNLIDKHFCQKGKIQYFDININSKLIRFYYGTSNIKKTRNFNEDFTDRTTLAKVIKDDNSSKKIIYVIIKKQKKDYLQYESDHMLRNITE